MSTLTDHPAVTELEARSGPSDKDKAAWLTFRLGGLTATEIRDLMVKGPTFRRELIELKLGTRVDTFSGNQYTAWGKKREPIIAAWVASVWGIADESRVFYAADNSRLLCSPDGVGVTWAGDLELSEIKTSGHDIAPGTAKYDQVGYLYQMIWCMRVTGARRCRYVWEQHDGDWRNRGGENPEPAPLHAPLSVVIDYDEAIAAELERVALGFLDELDAGRRALEAGESAAYDDELDTLAFNVIKFRTAETEATKAKEAAWAQLKAKLADKAEFSQESTLAKISWKRGGSTTGTESVVRSVVDEEAALAARPAVAAKLEAAKTRFAAATVALEKAQLVWDLVLEKHTTTATVDEPTTKTVRENLTVTAPKIKGKKA